MSENKVTMLTTDAILGATTLEEQLVEIPELGGSVKIREFDKARQQWIRNQAKDKRTGKIDESKLELLLFAYGVVEPVFTVDQVANLAKVKASVLDTVLSAITKLSGMTDEAVEEEEVYSRGTLGPDSFSATNACDRSTRL